MNDVEVFRERGFSLVELLVAVVIGVVVMLAVASTIVRSDGGRRANASLGDANGNDSGMHAALVLDRAIRNAGSGFSQHWNVAYGCRLDASKSGDPVLPLPAPVPVPSAFHRLSELPIRLAPVIIGKGMANAVSGQTRGDVLIVMSGSSSIGDSVTVGAGADDAMNGRMLVNNALGYRTRDLVLLANAATDGCMLQQVESSGTVANPEAANSGRSASQALTLNGAYYRATGTNVKLSDFRADASVLQFGPASAAQPQFMAYGVGVNRTLFGFDMLQPMPVDGSVPDTPISSGIDELHAVYGLDTNEPPDGKLDTWVDPTGAFAAAALTDGSMASRARLRQIVAIRIALVVRSPTQERSASVGGDPRIAQGVGAGPNDTSTVTLFGDLPATLQQHRKLNPTERGHRLRSLELTIPLRNVQWAPTS